MILLLCLVLTGCAHGVITIDDAAMTRLLHAAQVVREVDRAGGHIPGRFIDLRSPPHALTIVKTDSLMGYVVVDSTIVLWGEDNLIERITIHRDGVPIRRSEFMMMADGLREIIRNSADNRSALFDDSPYIDTVIWTAAAHGMAGCVMIESEGGGDRSERLCFCPDDSIGRSGILTWDLEEVTRYDIGTGGRKSRTRMNPGREHVGECDDDANDPGMSLGSYIVRYGESDGPFYTRIATVDDYSIDGMVITRWMNDLDEGETLSEDEIHARIGQDRFNGSDTLLLDTSTGLPIRRNRSSTRWRYYWSMKEFTLSK